MTDPVSLTAPEPSLPPSSRGRAFWLGLGTLALLIVVGAAWALGRDGAANSQPAASIHAVDDHTSAATHPDDEFHTAEASAVDEHEGDGHTEPTAHGAVEAHGHADAETLAHAETAPAHAAEQAAHSEADGHDTQATPVSPRIKQVVLGGFLGINGLVVLAAAVLRRRNPPRLPKYLQHQTQGSKP